VRISVSDGPAGPPRSVTRTLDTTDGNDNVRSGSCSRRRQAAKLLTRLPEAMGDPGLIEGPLLDRDGRGDHRHRGHLFLDGPNLVGGHGCKFTEHGCEATGEQNGEHPFDDGVTVIALSGRTGCAAMARSTDRCRVSGRPRSPP